MNSSQNSAWQQETQMNNLLQSLESLNQLQLHALNQVAQYRSLLIQLQEFTHDTLNTTSAEYEVIRKTLSANSWLVKVFQRKTVSISQLKPLYLASQLKPLQESPETTSLQKTTLPSGSHTNDTGANTNPPLPSQ